MLLLTSLLACAVTRAPVEPAHRELVELPPDLSEAPGDADLVVERTTRIEAAPADVLEALRDIDAWLEWDANLSHADPAQPGPLDVGHRFAFDPGGFEIAVEVQLVDEHRLLWRGEAVKGNSVGVRSFHVHPDGDGTRVVLHEDFYGSAFRWFGWMSDFGIGKGMEATLAGLKQHVEAQ